MTKRSQRRPARYDNSGCMWGFISILDFRHASRSNWKLLADKRCGELLTNIESSTNIKEPPPPPPPQGTAMYWDGKDSIGEITDTSKPSVKTLIEEEMVTEPKSGLKKQDQGHEDRKKKKKKKNRRRSKGNSSFDVENDMHNVNNGIMEEFCSHIYERSRSRSVKNPENNNKEKLREVIKDFISQELMSGKHLTESGGVNFPQELVDVLQIPNLDEESFVNHLGDPSSLLLKYVQSLEDAHLSKQKSEDSVTNKPRKFFRRNVKNNQETLNLSKEHEENQASRIVILKPGPHDLTCNPSKRNLFESSSDSSQAQPLQRTNSPFFLAEIKRRWKNVMGKEQPGATVSNSVAIDSEKKLKKGEKSNLGKKSPSKDHFYIEKIARPRKEEKVVKLKDAEESVGTESGNSSKRRVPNIYIEAKRHLSEMLNSGIEEVDSSDRRSPKTLARILSLSEFESPIPSPRWDRDRSSFLASPMRFPGHREVGKNKGEVGNHTVENKEIEEKELSNKLLSSNEGGESSSATCRDGICSEGNTEELRTTEIIEEEECSSCTNVLFGGDRSHPLETLDRDSHVQELLKEEVVHHGEESAPSSPVESPPPSSSRTKTNNENLQVAEDKPFERESPVSVLEPLFMEDEEDISSPRRRTSSSPSAHELPIRPLQIKFEDDGDISSESKATYNISRPPCTEEEEETLATYIRALLRACGGLNWDELYMKSQSSDQPLDPSLLNEVDFHCSHHHAEHDQNLIFDCINEILLEICDRHFGCCPCVLFAGNPRVRSVPDMEGTVSEVWEGVHWHLVRLAPRTLDHVVREDMSRSGSWMDLRSDTETFGLELGDDILDDLIEETVTVTKITSGFGFYPVGESIDS